LQAKPSGGQKWLASLREKELSDVIEALCTLPGVGPKVAACIALFSLDQNHAIPVDTHVWKVCYIAISHFCINVVTIASTSVVSFGHTIVSSLIFLVRVELV
jgi:endonuclease III